MKKILVITYYWPPLGGSGVQRWLKFVKYLPQFGWKPYVFTPENPAYTLIDESLQKDIPREAEIVRFPIWEPYETATRLLGLISGKKGGANTKGFVPQNKSASEKLISWIRGNIFIPDTRVFWVGPSIKFLTDFLKKNEIHTIVTTGPPHSMHLIGKGLKQKNPNLKWIADFRDPWSQWGFLDSVKAGKFARKIHHKLEASVLGTADNVIIVTPFYQRQFEKLSNREVHLITNGYDNDDFKNLKIAKTRKFMIRHVGFVNEKHDFNPFLAAVEELINGERNFGSAVQLDFVGEVHPSIKNFIEKSKGLSLVTTFTSTVSHKELVSIYGKSSLLLLVLSGIKDAEGYLTGKLFEYMATGLPVLGVGPEHGDAAALLRESGAGKMIDADNKAAIKKYLMETFIKWANSESPVTKARDAGAYSRENLTKKLVDLLGHPGA